MTSPTTPVNEPTQTTAERSPKKPTDRATKSAQLQAESTPPVGHDTLRPVIEMRSGAIAEAQAVILELFEEIGLDLDADPDEKQEIETSPRVIRALGRLAGVLESCAVDVDGFVAVDTGPGAQGRVMDLAMWYLGQLGESDGSAS